MNANDRIALTIGRLVMQLEAQAEQLEELKKQLAEAQKLPHSDAA